MCFGQVSCTAEAEHAVASQQATADKTAAAPPFPPSRGQRAPPSSSQTSLYINGVEIPPKVLRYSHDWTPSHSTVLSTWAVCDSTCVAAEAEHAVASQQDTAGKTAATFKQVVFDKTFAVAEAEHAVASQEDTAGKTAATPTPAGSGSPTKQPSSPSKGGSGSAFGGLFGSGGSKGGSGSVSSWLPSWGGGKKETEQVKQAGKPNCQWCV